MSISPINITRVSHNLRTMSMLESTRRNLVDLFGQQNRLATGRNFVTASEDPVAAAQALNLRESLDRQSQILSNLRHADLMLSASDDALSEVNDLLNQAESLASRSIGAQANADERQANAALISEIRERLMIVGNRRVNGQYIFAGRDTEEAPFVSALGGIAYIGDTGDVLARVSRLEQESINVPGNVLFGALSSSIGGGTNLNPGLTAQTRLDDLAGANLQGIRRGSIAITSSSGASILVDVTSADTVGDILDMLNAALESSGSGATVAIDGRGLAITGAGLTIADPPNGATASDLGLVVSAASPAAAGVTDLVPRISPITPIDVLNGGTGIDQDAGFKITNGPNSVVIDLSEATSVQDIINEINAAGLFAHARVNDAGTGIEVVSQLSGAEMSISENGGTTAADLGLLTFSRSTGLETLNSGRGVETVLGEPDLRITDKTGAAFDVNLDGAETIGDVLDMINFAAADAGVAVESSLTVDGNGIALVDSSGGAAALTIERGTQSSFAIEDLGLADLVEGAEPELAGHDVATVRAEGVFTALLDLESALLGNDERAISDTAERMTQFNEDITREHGIIGARAQSMRARIEQTENAVIATRSFLSDIEDLDYTEAITRFQQAQTALQANLLSGSQLLNLSLLDFLR